MDFKELLAKMKPEHAAQINLVIKAKDDAIAEAVQKQKDAEDALEEVKKNAPAAPEASTEEEILKTVKDPAVRKLLEQQILKTKAAEEIAKQLTDAQNDKEAIAKAKEVPGLGAEEAKLAEVYKKLKTVDSQLCEDVFGIFKAASALVNEGGALTEIGKTAGTVVGGGDETAAWGKIEAAADEIVKNVKISKAAAIRQVMNDQPELYDQYVKAQKG